MAATTDGGSAFPEPDAVASDGTNLGGGSSGMSLRQYFAAHAPEMPEDFVKQDPWTGHGHLQCLSHADKRAFWAFTYADAMLKRSGKP